MDEDAGGGRDVYNSFYGIGKMLNRHYKSHCFNFQDFGV